jgi:hypothetical protein
MAQGFFGTVPSVFTRDVSKEYEGVWGFRFFVIRTIYKNIEIPIKQEKNEY